MKRRVTPDTLHAILEGTGVYHEQAALALSDTGVTVWIVNPAQVKDFGRSLGIRTKTDSIDRLVLARFAALNSPRPWTPAPPLKCGYCKPWRGAAKPLPKLYSASVLAWKKPMRPTNCALIRQTVVESIEFLAKQLTKLKQHIDHHFDQHSNQKADSDLLLSIPAVGPQVGNHLLANKHNHPFQSAEQLAPDLDLVPLERQSGTSLLGRPRLSKAGPARIRAAL
jgi:transposase